jgi:hypothetical protein
MEKIFLVQAQKDSITNRPEIEKTVKDLGFTPVFVEYSSDVTWPPSVRIEAMQTTEIPFAVTRKRGK